MWFLTEQTLGNNFQTLVKGHVLLTYTVTVWCWKMNGFRYEQSLHKIIIAASEHICPLLLLHCVLQYTLYIHIFSQGNVTTKHKINVIKKQSSLWNNRHESRQNNNPIIISDRSVQQTYLSRAGCKEISYNTCTSLQSHGCKKLCKAFYVYKYHLCPEMHASIVYRVLHVLLSF